MCSKVLVSILAPIKIPGNWHEYTVKFTAYVRAVCVCAYKYMVPCVGARLPPRIWKENCHFSTHECSIACCWVINDEIHLFFFSLYLSLCVSVPYYLQHHRLPSSSHQPGRGGTGFGNEAATRVHASPRSQTVDTVKWSEWQKLILNPRPSLWTVCSSIRLK